MYDVIIVGAGAAGLMAAVRLEEASVNYLLLEKNEEVGKKLLISGGSRCNVTNNLDIDTFIANLTMKNKKFLYPAMYTFGPDQVVDFFKENNVPLILQDNFKYFPSTNKSSSIVQALLENIDKKRIKYNASVTKISKDVDHFRVQCGDEFIRSKNVIIATGSESFPKTGSTGFGLKVAKHFGIDNNPFQPAETHIYSEYVKSELNDLQGTSIQNAEVIIKGTKLSSKGDLLFTHFGLSGPVIYHLSEFIHEEHKKGNQTLVFPLTSKTEEEFSDLLSDRSVYILKVLDNLVSKRLARKILSIVNLENKKISQYTKDELLAIKKTLLAFEVVVSRVESKEKAYVNKGGISIKEISPQTYEVKKVPGLYFVGETVDIHGPIGGYNITMAFASGTLAAYHIIEKL